MLKSSINITIIDDEPFMLRLLCKMLKNIGFTSATTFESGSAALAWMNNSGSHVDLILLDLNMPEMDGIEFIRKLVEGKFTGSVILVSGEDERMLQMAENLIQSHGINVLGHLHKPASNDDLSRLMEKSLEIQKVFRAPRKVYSANELKFAIANNELVNYYQPKIEVETGAVIGVETLVRWSHAVDGMVYPDQFISLAEENGLIDSLTRVVLVNAINQAKTWQQAGLKLKVAINVSMDNLSSLNFADFVEFESIKAGVATQDIVLEVTESRLMRNQCTSLDTLTRLRLKRFHLSIDDFGTGHSSLSQLCDIPFDELKIDKSFVSGAWHKETARAIYNASLALGHQLGMTVVAEGVEDIDDWNMVRQTKCDIAQGYFIARPMPASEVAAWVGKWNLSMQQYQIVLP